MKEVLRKTLLAALALCLLGSAGPWSAYAADSISGNLETPVYPEAGPAETALPTSDLVVTSCQALDPFGRPASTITKGMNVTFVLTLKNSGIATDQVGGGADLDVSHLLDSFTGGGAPTAEVLSQGHAPLEVQVTLPGMTYSGSGRELRLMMGYRQIPIPYDRTSISVFECREYVEPEPVPPTPPPTSPEPMFLMSRADHIREIPAGESSTLMLKIENIGATAISSGVISITPSAGLTLLDNTFAHRVGPLSPGQSALLYVAVRTSEAADAAQSLSLQFSYSYFSAGAVVQGSATAQVPVLAEVRPVIEAAEPVFQFGREGVLEPIAAGQEAVVTVWVKNLGEVCAQSPVLSLAPSAGLMLMEDSTSRVLNDLAPGQMEKMQVRLKALSDLSSPAQELDMDLRYRYDNGKTAAQGTASGKLVIPARPKAAPSETTPVAASTPGVIVQQYSYGDSQVAAGSSFPLSLTFANTSQAKPVENITISLETDEGLSITSSSNTFYFPALTPGGSVTQSLDVMAANSEKTTSPSIGITFKYEYVDQGTRHSVTSSEKISIPVYQPIRLEVTPPTVPEDAAAGSEVMLTLPYVNKGRGTVYNVSAVLEGDVPALVSVQNIGNLEPGKSGSIDFILTPEAAGDIQFTVRLSYETASAEPLTMEIPVTLSVGEAYEEPPYEWDEPGMDEPEEPPLSVPALAIPAAVSIVAAVVLVVMLKRKKQRTQPQSGDWDEDDFADTPQEQNDENN